jgi:hypothetical protein
MVSRVCRELNANDISCTRVAAFPQLNAVDGTELPHQLTVEWSVSITSSMAIAFLATTAL